MSTEAALREIKGTVAERIFLWLAETAEHPSPPQVAQALNLLEIDAQTACHWLEELRLVEFDNSMAMTMHVSIQGQGSAKRLLAERASGKDRRLALHTSLLNRLSAGTLLRESMADFAVEQGTDGSPFTEQEIRGGMAYLQERGLIKGVRGPDGQLLMPSLSADGRDCVDHFGSDIQAWRLSPGPGMVTHNRTTFNNSPGAQSMTGSPGAQQTATVTISADNRHQLLQIADQIAEQIVGLPTGVAPAATAGVEELRKAAQVDYPDEDRVKAALGKIAMSVAVAVGTTEGLKIIDLIGHAGQLLGG